MTGRPTDPGATYWELWAAGKKSVEKLGLAVAEADQSAARDAGRTAGSVATATAFVFAVVLVLKEVAAAAAVVVSVAVRFALTSARRYETLARLAVSSRTHLSTQPSSFSSPTETPAGIFPC